MCMLRKGTIPYSKDLVVSHVYSFIPYSTELVVSMFLDTFRTQRISRNRTVANTNNKISVELEDLDEQIKAMMTRTEKRTHDGKEFITKCNVCGKETASRNMTKHIESIHITGVTHACNICGKTSRSRSALKFHKYAFHKTM